ncbi:MAG: hypothetical protein LUH40_04255 [Clostridiales bacterium]|nr:hypothetical protein [Clostridiales bacterium]
MKSSKRILAVLLAMLLAFSVCPITVLSADEDSGTSASEDGGSTTSGTYEQEDIGEELTGDYAYLSDIAMVEDSTTESGYAIRTGTSPWDSDDEAGNDSCDINNSVRTYDIAEYTVTFTSRIRDDSPYKVYRQGNLYFEFVLQGTSDEIQFETGSMGWLSAKDAVYTITEEEVDGVTCQVLRGYYSWQPSSGNDHAIGESTQELSLIIRILAMSNGDQVQPEFTFFLQDNDVGVDYADWGTEDYAGGAVTGSGYECAEHGEQEFGTVVAPSITVSAKPNYNVYIGSTSTSYQIVGTWDFTTGNTLALDKDAGSVYGRLGSWGVSIQIVGKDSSQGLRGIEMPKEGEEITFTLTLSSVFAYADGSTTVKTDVSDTYTPLVWSFGPNVTSSTKQDGRVVSTTNTAATMVPYNKLGNYTYDSYYYRSCYDGGSWSITDNGDGTYDITVKDFQLDMSQLPYTYSGGSKLTYTYYDPTSVTNYWEVQTAVISAAGLWIVQPFYNNETGEYVVDEYNDGTFTTTLKDTDLTMTSASGQTQTDPEGTNKSQANTKDDSVGLSLYVTKPGTISQQIGYLKYNYSAWNDSLTDGCWETGRDWILKGNKLVIEDYICHDAAEGLNTGVAYDELIKFDDVFFDIEYAKSGNSGTIYYAAKPDGTGWSHKDKNGNELKPDEDGYDTEMKYATTDDLVYFSSLSELEEAGYTCVGVLVEYRKLQTDQMNHLHSYLYGSAKTTAEAGYVYMTTHYARAWNRGDLLEAINSDDDASNDMTEAELLALTDSEIKTLTDEYIPVRSSFDFGTQLEYAEKSAADEATYLYDEYYPDAFWINGGRDGTSGTNGVTSNSIRNYVKPTYVNGVYVSGNYEGTQYGDSCLLVAYSSGIDLSIAQTSSSGDEKAAFDMDTSQRIADYKLQGTITFGTGIEDNQETQTTTIDTVTMTVTLPSSLTYLEGSSYIGGTYTQNGEGVQGTVPDGTLLKENETVTAVTTVNGTEYEYTVTLNIALNSDGTTTLTYTLNNVTIEIASAADATQYLDAIHFSAQIGTAGIDSTDVQNGDSITAEATIQTSDDNTRPMTAANGNYSESSILVSKNSAISLVKYADQSVVNLGEEMGFTLEVGNNSSNSLAIVAVDNLPYEGDGVSNFSGDLYVTSLQVYSSHTTDEDGNVTYTYVEGTDFVNIKFYYTTDTSYRGKVSSDLTDEDFTDTDVWKELTVTSEGVITIPYENFSPVLFTAVGTLAGDETLNIHMTVSVPGANAKDYIVNTLTRGSLSSSARCRIVNRYLSGLAWYDANADGVQNSGTGFYGDEKEVNGVRVELLKLSDTGDYESVAAIYTGQEYNIGSGTTTDYTEGNYRFSGLSAGTYKVVFSAGNYAYFSTMAASPVNAGDDDTKDSDAEAYYVNDALSYAEITGIEMPEASTMEYGSYTDDNNDFGFYYSSAYSANDIVIDFGLPVDNKITTWDDSISSLSGKAAYGTVSVSKSSGSYWTVTYTPTTVLMGIDTVTLTDESSNEYTFKVYPATTVYYEEGFAKYGTGWKTDTSSNNWSGTTSVSYSTKQQTEIALDAAAYNNYNYDEAYDSSTDTTYSTGSTKGDSLTFTFTGTGIDIFAIGTASTGTVNVLVMKSIENSSAIVKMITVDTTNQGDYATNGSAYNTPIVSLSGLDYGTYTVVIYVTIPSGEGFEFDGFRVYNTCYGNTDAQAVYEAAMEDNPDYFELRDYVVAGLNIDRTKSDYADALKQTVAQVYSSAVGETSGVVVAYDEGDETLSKLLTNAEDELSILDQGPKNEMYLYSGMTAVFTISTDREVQIGLRSVDGSDLTVKISDRTNTQELDISSCVDMFYTLQSKGATGEITYSITVSGGILSITDIKVCDSAEEALFAELTEEALISALSIEEETAEEETDASDNTAADDTAADEAAADETESGSSVEETQSGIQKILAAIVEVIQKIISFFKSIL